VLKTKPFPVGIEMTRLWNMGTKVISFTELMIIVAIVAILAAT